MINQIFQSLMTLYDFLISHLVFSIFHSIATPALWIFQMEEIPARMDNRAWRVWRAGGFWLW
jgi:hypothetical protein